MGEEKQILLRGNVCAYLTCRLMGDPFAIDPFAASISNATGRESTGGDNECQNERPGLAHDVPFFDSLFRFHISRGRKFATQRITEKGVQQVCPASQ